MLTSQPVNGLRELSVNDIRRLALAAAGHKGEHIDIVTYTFDQHDGLSVCVDIHFRNHTDNTFDGARCVRVYREVVT